MIDYTRTVHPYVRWRMLAYGEAPAPNRHPMAAEYRLWSILNGKHYLLHERGTCHCREQTIVVPLRTRLANGRDAVVWRCIFCGHKRRESSASKCEHLDDLLWWDDRTDTTPCERCGATNGVEWHHWAPRHLFEDADDWPTGLLCRACHQEWHQVVTPNMSQRRAS